MGAVGLAMFILCPFLIGRVSLFSHAIKKLKKARENVRAEMDKLTDTGQKTVNEAPTQSKSASVPEKPGDRAISVLLPGMETAEILLPVSSGLGELIRRWEKACPLKKAGEKWVLMASRRGADDAVLAVVTRSAEGQYTLSQEDYAFPFGNFLTAYRIGPEEDQPGMLRHGAVSWPSSDEMPLEGMTVKYFGHTITCSITFHYQDVGTGSHVGWIHDGGSRTWQDSEFKNAEEALAAIDQVFYDSAPYKSLYSREQIRRVLAAGFDAPYNTVPGWK